MSVNFDDEHSKIVLFLGAGASSFAGYRTFNTFPDLIFEDKVRIQAGLQQLHDSTKKILEEIRISLDIARKPTTHDNFLWVLNDYKRLWETFRVDGVLRARFLKSTTQQGQFAHFSQIIEDAISDITSTTLQHYSTNRVQDVQGQADAMILDAMHRVRQLYTRLALINDNESPFLPIFTTNYDMLLEDIFSTFNNTQSCYFPLINGIPDCMTHSAAWDEMEYQRYGSRPQGLFLYRIHGCVCWFYHGLGDEKVYFHRKDCLQQEAKNLCAMYPGREGYLGLNPHSFGFNQFHKMLLSCQIVVFIGFSFRDADVLHLILSANAQRDTPLNMIILDPVMRDTDILARFRDAKKITQFPSRVPEVNEITLIDAYFGISDFDNRLINSINQLLTRLL